MRDYLKDINLVGATMCYREGNKCRWALDWLCAHCNYVIVVLDNWDEETEKIVLEYKEKYPEIIRVSYSDEPANERMNAITGQIKRRFKLRQNHIREHVIKSLRKLHDEKPIDLVVWLDSDEVLIDEFPKYLEEFWIQRPEQYMALGFVEVFDGFNKIISQKMATHGRIFKYTPEMTAHPYATRTRYYPYKNMRAWTKRFTVVHVCSLTEEYRKQREFFDHMSWEQEAEKRNIWFLPKDVRQMTLDEIAEYQPGHHQAPSVYPPTLLKDYLINKKNYVN